MGNRFFTKGQQKAQQEINQKLQNAGIILNSEDDVIRRAESGLISPDIAAGMLDHLTPQASLRLKTALVKAAKGGRVQNASKASLIAGLPAHIKNHPKFQEYVREAEHQDGSGYWRYFSSSKELQEDFERYISFGG